MRYSSDYSCVLSDGKCVPSGPERIPNTQCTLGTPSEKYMGSSGYRKILGNKCEGGSCMVEPMSKGCSGGECFKGGGGSVSHVSFAAEPVEGAIVHQIVCFLF
jgi:hypothetical protein